MASLNGPIVVLVFAFVLYRVLWQQNQPAEITTKDIKQVYDYVVIGGGSAGSVVSARLAEDPSLSVLVLESGSYYDSDSIFYEPSRWVELLNTQYDWTYLTESQEHAFHGMNENRGLWPRGRILGGSGMINALQYTRGSPFDYDEWASNGCTGWSYEDVFPYFLKTEDIQIEELKDSVYHHAGGEIAVTGGETTPFSSFVKRAGQELGYPITDYNGEDQVGFSNIQFNIRKGVRSSSAMEFFKTKRENLDIATDCHVSKIDIVDMQAVGVYFIRDGRKKYVEASKEIIVSAGSINSPQILMLSGVGPKDHLQQLNIPLVVDLPVGNYLHDHQQVGMCTNITKPITLTQDNKESFLNTIQYKLFGSGLQGITGADGSAFLHLDKTRVGKTYPDIQLVFFAGMIGANVFNFKENVAVDVIPKSLNEHGICVFIALTHPRSRGTIRLKSSDPFDYPLIDPQYFSNPEDVQDIIGGIRIWEQIMETKAFKELGVDINYMQKSFCSQHEFRSNEYWECIVRSTGFTQFHPTSTCRMGATDDVNAVVDPELRVKGVKGLRVVDASIFPKVTSGNTNAPTVMVAEKASDIIMGKDSVKQLRQSFKDN